MYTEGTFFISLLNVFADEEEEQAANISVAEQDFKFMDFARRYIYLKISLYYRFGEHYPTS